MEEQGRGRRRRKVVVESEVVEEAMRPPRRRKRAGAANFHCDLCPATSYTQGGAARKQRFVVDELTGARLALCNACGLRLKRKQKQKPVVEEAVVAPSGGGKAEYLAQGEAFGQRIGELVGDTVARRFFCPKFRGSAGCGCLQAFLQSPLPADAEEVAKRGRLLLRYYRKAEELVQGGRTEGAATRSAEFEEFVLTNRDYLKSQLRLCEPAVQRILLYSNNFLYKAPAGGGRRVEAETTGGRQVARVEAGRVLEEHATSCTCGTGAALEQEQVVRWRAVAGGGQAARRAVVEEMWREAGGRTCRQLVQLVTGAGLSAIGRQLAQLRKDAS